MKEGIGDMLVELLSTLYSLLGDLPGSRLV